MIKILSFFLLILIVGGASTPVLSQQPNGSVGSARGLFDSDELLELTLTGNIRDLLNDRLDPVSAHAIQLSYFDEHKTEVVIRTQFKTRGRFRRLKENCSYPPLSINFLQSDTLGNSIFREQRKMKLVMPCQGDQYVVREWLVYKIYNLVTPKSFRARLVKVKMNDTKNNKIINPFYAILLEEEQQMAKRNQAVAITRKLNPRQTETRSFINMAIFQYLVGNTDWSVQYQQNIKLVAADSVAVPFAVPYDFDHSGIVNTMYARPAELLEMSSVVERRYRGYCIKNMQDYTESIELFNNLKKDIYALYTGSPLLDAKYVKRTTSYLDDFYAIINNPKTLQKEFQYPCDPRGTGNVVIKGLKED